MFHISDLKKYLRCERLFLLDYFGEPHPFERFVRLDEETTPLIMEKLEVQQDQVFLGQKNDSHELAMKALGKYEWMIKPRFEYKNLRIKVPVMHLTENGYDIYFNYMGLFPKTSNMHKYCAVVYVLNKLNIPINHFYILHLNAEYERKQDLDAKELFVISDCFYNNNNNPSVKIGEAICEHMEDYDEILTQMEELLSKPLPEPERLPRCATRQKCLHYSECFPHEKVMDDNSILTLSCSQYRYHMEEQGATRLKDVNLDQLEGTRFQYAQIMADRNGGLFVDKTAMKQWLSDVQFPITFVDFEWECFAIPPYPGMHPYDVLPFEYSIHIMDEKGKIQHKTFLTVHDGRKEFAESLINDIPKTGTVFAYNAFAAEKLRMDELGTYFPELKQGLDEISARLKDLQIPFATGLVYDVRMRGFYSLKTLMAMLDDKGYSTLDIQQGMEAVFQWRRLDLKDPEADQKSIIEKLKDYCGMDTYAMIVVYNWLKKIANC